VSSVHGDLDVADRCVHVRRIVDRSDGNRERVFHPGLSHVGGPDGDIGRAVLIVGEVERKLVADQRGGYEPGIRVAGHRKGEAVADVFIFEYVGQVQRRVGGVLGDLDVADGVLQGRLGEVDDPRIRCIGGHWIGHGVLNAGSRGVDRQGIDARQSGRRNLFEANAGQAIALAAVGRVRADARRRTGILLGEDVELAVGAGVDVVPGGDESLVGSAVVSDPDCRLVGIQAVDDHADPTAVGRRERHRTDERHERPTILVVAVAANGRTGEVVGGAGVQIREGMLVPIVLTCPDLQAGASRDLEVDVAVEDIVGVGARRRHGSAGGEIGAAVRGGQRHTGGGPGGDVLQLP